VRVVLSTHAVGGITLPDLVIAAKLDALPVEYSPKWLREHEAAASTAG
jgi:4a-hydroxytetrahydrobiopterin dehydratase